jgi:hypothetical protein
MVIPYGAFQVSKARNAEYISNMLAAGAEDIQITTIVDDVLTEKGDDNIGFRDNGTITKPFIPIYLVDPLVTSNSYTNVFELVPTGFAGLMFGKDDLDYVLRDGARTKMQEYGSDKQQYLKQYSYFVTIKTNYAKYNSNTEKVNVKFTTDLLGCYKRTDEDVAFMVEPDADPTNSQIYSKAAKLRIITSGDRRLDFSTTRYVFITWDKTWLDGGVLTTKCGEWCRVVSVNEVPEVPNRQDIVVLANEFVSEKNINIAGNLAEPNDIKIFIFPGVMYHKRIYD